MKNRHLSFWTGSKEYAWITVARRAAQAAQAARTVVQTIVQTVGGAARVASWRSSRGLGWVAMVLVGIIGIQGINLALLRSPLGAAAIAQDVPGVADPGNSETPDNPKQKPLNPVADLQDELEIFLPPALLDQIDTAAVRFDGRTLFKVGAPASGTDPAADAKISAKERVRRIRANLYEVARSSYQPDALNVEVQTYPQAPNSPVINVDETYIMTVTAADAQIVGPEVTPAQRAEELQDIIVQALQRYKVERQPDYILKQSLVALLLVGIAVLLSIGLFYSERGLRRMRRHLKRNMEDSAILTASPSQPAGESHQAVLHQYLDRQRRVAVIDVAIPVIWVIKLIILAGTLYIGFGVIPFTRWLQPVVIALTPLPLQILAVAWVTYVALRIASNLVDRFFLALKDRMMVAPEASQRTALRFSTFSKVITGVMAFVAWSGALLFGLSSIGIQLAPLLAGAGILGIGISFASQSLIKDIINGFFILLEDQYGVGDVVVIGEVAGFVENMNLRITQLRNEEGRLITIPNSHIVVVQNLSKEWSRVDVMIDVAHHSDLDEAIALIRKVADQMCQDPKWRAVILEPPLMLGVDRLDYRGATVRMWIKTKPLKQWDVAREYRRQLKHAFDAHGIAIGIPQHLVSFQSDRPLTLQPNPAGLSLLNGESSTNGHH